jgi:CBS domain-containing protein
MQLAELESPISDVVPHIFKRPVLSVSPEDSLLQAGILLATGPQIYVDGLVVLDEQKPVGRIGGQHIIQYILQHQDGWFHSTASQIMSHATFAVGAGEPLDVALEIFNKTRFAFVPITINGSVATSLSVRDVLRLAAGKLDTPVGELSSKLISVSGSTSIKKALELMLEKSIRNLAVTNDNDDALIINDRKILEFLLSYEGGRVVTSPTGLDVVSVDVLDMLAAKHVRRNTPADIAAEFLSDINTPCLICEDSIVTPWDIVMKGLFKA